MGLLSVWKLACPQERTHQKASAHSRGGRQFQSSIVAPNVKWNQHGIELTPLPKFLLLHSTRGENHRSHELRSSFGREVGVQPPGLEEKPNPPISAGAPKIDLWITEKNCNIKIDPQASKACKNSWQGKYCHYSLHSECVTPPEGFGALSSKHTARAPSVLVLLSRETKGSAV